jgi:hypothetical protein
VVGTVPRGADGQPAAADEYGELTFVDEATFWATF